MKWLKGTVNGVYTEQRDDGLWVYVDDDTTEDQLDPMACVVCGVEITTAWVEAPHPMRRNGKICRFKHANVNECMKNLEAQRLQLVVERTKRHTDRGGCPAIIYHGPGRQSDSFCQKPAGHEGHHQVIVECWEWEGNEAIVDDWGDVHERGE